VSSVGVAWTTKKQLSEEDDQEVQETVNVLHDKMSGLEEGVKIQKERYLYLASYLAGEQMKVLMKELIN